MEPRRCCRRPIWIWIVGLTITYSGLTSCAGPDEQLTDGDGANLAAEVSAEGAAPSENLPTLPFGSPQATVPASDDTQVPRSPVELTLGYTADAEELATEYYEAELAYFESIRICMAKEGFSELSIPDVEQSEPEDFLARDRAAALRILGYGATLHVRNEFEIASNVISGVEQTSEAQTPLSKLSEEDRIAYANAWSQCESTAFAETPNPALSELPSQIAEDVYAIREAAETGEDAILAWSDWSRCMAEEGYNVADTFEAEELANEFLEPIMATVLELQGGGDEADLERAGAQLEQFASLEQELANVDADCSESTGVHRRIQEAIYEAEAEWLDSNLERIALVLAEE